MIPVPEGPEGKAYSPYGAPAASRMVSITADAEDPAFCAMLGDWFYEPSIPCGHAMAWKK